LELIQKLPDVVIYRRELWREMAKAIGECAAGIHPSILAAAWKVRSRTSLVGRKVEKRLVSWPPLIKGLEFDHSIVLDADALKAKELYVAMTRGVQSLTIISASPILQKPSPFSVTPG
jgi:DNA helicase-2/ATP-dependent DNA helicase PcrA